MENQGLRNAITSRNNCLQAVSETEDFEEARACWGMAKRYNQLAREKMRAMTGREAVTALTRAELG